MACEQYMFGSTDAAGTGGSSRGHQWRGRESPGGGTFAMIKEELKELVS